ncbi:hypothetical protein Bca52824_010339 [Brassica carinata]|uniref:Cysteine/Histidine-rich C1 domain family protein n=1 Tax=Brassica carinata TaxID=52824 RepID=A0A8X7WDQ3_BRACI|nr:hypothetical protein Bca52824_010339 [Brassica carinata]
MDSVQHPPPIILVCPFLRGYSLEKCYDADTKFPIINSPHYYPSTVPECSLPSRYFDHRLYPLYRCNNKVSGDESLCGACQCKEIGSTYYYCNKCGVPFHKECVESIGLIKSLYHPKHHLQLLTYSLSFLFGVDLQKATCSCCGGYPRTLFTYFTIVLFVSLVCILFARQNPHSLTSLSSMCLQCDFVVHKIFIYLPFVIRISRHNHRLSFTYSSPRILSCGVCRQVVDGNYGKYSCIKDCLYGKHSKCATRRDVWDEKELEEEPEEEYENLNSFEVIGAGIIQHFSHSHHLKFEKKTTDIMYDERCQACVIPFYGGDVYKCMKSNCDFVLHEACANLPRTKQHITHPYPFILQVSDTKNCFLCGYCDRFLYGFRYVCSKEGESISIDLLCAAISEPFDHQCHPHPLFLSNEHGTYRPCSMCRKERLYEHDEHFLTLSYEENASLSWCEVCEETLDSNKWLYTCNECRVTFHIPCLLGKCALYVKPSQHLLLSSVKIDIFVNDSLTRPICYKCGRRCQDKLMLKVTAADDNEDDDDDDDDDDEYINRPLCYRHWAVDSTRNPNDVKHHDREKTLSCIDGRLLRIVMFVTIYTKNKKESSKFKTNIID